MIESAMVMPIIIFFTICFMGLCVFLYIGLESQCKMHTSLNNKRMECNEAYKVYREDINVSYHTKGMFADKFYFNRKDKITCIKESAVIRWYKLGRGMYDKHGAKKNH